jgi:hypothetical protein
VIDLAAVIAAAGARLYPPNNGPVHFNEAGYRLVTDALAERLRSMN